MYFLFNRTTLQVFVTYLTGALYVHTLWFYRHQHDNRVHSKLFVACQWWWFQWRYWFVPSVPSGEMHNYCTPHIIKQNSENFLTHRCNYILLSQVYCVWQAVKTPTIIFIFYFLVAKHCHYAYFEASWLHYTPSLPRQLQISPHKSCSSR